MFIEELEDLEQDYQRPAVCANCKRVKPLYMYPRDSYEICMPCRAKAIENNHAYTCGKMPCTSNGDFNEN